MIKTHLDLSRPSSLTFQSFIDKKYKCKNLFVVTHLGQLKQMEALIISKGIEDNCLVVLYTFKNLVVPQTVQDQYSNLFKQVVFLEIPFGVNKVNFKKLRNTSKSYKELLNAAQLDKLYLCSWEAHYAILATIAKQNSVELILVEEGTATYKPNLGKSFEDSKSKNLTYKDIRNTFIGTVGQTQIFKKLVKIQKYNKDLYKQSKRFLSVVSKEEAFQRYLVNLVGDTSLKASLEPFKSFDKAYASSPELIKEGFGVQDVEYFLIHDVVSDESLEQAQYIIDKYGITKNDVLYVSQRYNLDPEQYANYVSAILYRMLDDKQKVFIKLHPKENKKIYDAFKYIEYASKGRFVVIEDNQFLIESVIRLSQIDRLVGITSTTLVYGIKVSPNTRAISIASELIDLLSSNKRNHKAFADIELHLAELKLFKNIEFR